MTVRVVWTAAAVAAALVMAPVGGHAQQAGDPVRGQAFAREACASCHAVRGNASSPNSAAPGFFEIAAVPGMTEMALTVSLQTSHRVMPNLLIAPGDRADVVAYILSLRGR